jgi:capsular polysaccharide biosynthesis protein
LETELRRLFRAGKRFWWIPVVLGLLLAPLTWLAGRLVEPTYMASTQLMITNSVTGADSVIDDGLKTQTYLTLVESGPVLDRVILEFGLDDDRFSLARKIEARVLPGTQIIEVQVRDEDPQQAADLANAVARHVEVEVAEISVGQMQRDLDALSLEAEVLRDRILVLDTRLNDLDVAENDISTAVQVEIDSLQVERLGLQQTLADINTTIRDLNANMIRTAVPIVLVDSAQPPTGKEGPGPIVFALLGFILGAMIGGCIILFLEYRDRTVRDREHLEQITSSHTLVTIPAYHAPEHLDSQDQLLIERLSAMAHTATKSRILFLTSRTNDVDRQLVNKMVGSLEHPGFVVVPSIGVLDEPEGLGALSQNSAAVIIVAQGKTSAQDAGELTQILKDLRVPLLGNVLFNT